MSVRLIQGDCLERMGEIEAGSIDLILTDPPYGVSSCRWDQVISFEPLWGHYKRLLKPRGAVVLTASQPFTSMLVMSNREWFKYCLVWQKSRGCDVFNAKNKPLRYHEDICVFSDGTTANRSPRRMTYNPQGVVPGDHGLRKTVRKGDGVYTSRPSHPAYHLSRQVNYPGSVLCFPSVAAAATVHPTQKPVALMEYLIRTYSNEGDTVLDSCMGSGTTLVACLNTNRHGIGIEKDADIFVVAEWRITSHQAAYPLLLAAESETA